jgi:hypothetical protein
MPSAASQWAARMLGSSPTSTMQPGSWNEAVSRPPGCGISCSGRTPAPRRRPVRRRSCPRRSPGPRTSRPFRANSSGSRVSLLGLAPGNGVVADDAARRMPERAQDWVPGGRADIKERGQPLDLGRPDHLGVDALRLVHLRPPRIARSGAPVWASVRWPRCENIMLSSRPVASPCSHRPRSPRHSCSSSAADARPMATGGSPGHGGSARWLSTWPGRRRGPGCAATQPCPDARVIASRKPQTTACPAQRASAN